MGLAVCCGWFRCHFFWQRDKAHGGPDGAGRREEDRCFGRESRSALKISRTSRANNQRREYLKGLDQKLFERGIHYHHVWNC